MNESTFLGGNAVWGAVVFLLVAILLYYKFKEWLKIRAQKKRFARGAKLEEAAAHFLKTQGFKVLDAQYTSTHSFYVDGEKHQVKIAVDYVVSKGGKTYLVEVKSGKSAISISNSNTRRQILEYAVAIPNDGVFLLDMENKKLQRIHFELETTVPSLRKVPLWFYFVLFLLGIIVGKILFC